MVIARSIIYQIPLAAITSSKTKQNFKKVEVRGCGNTHCAGATNEEKKMFARYYPTILIGSFYLMSLSVI